MWEYGGNDKEGVENPWRNGNKMAPFDQEVSKHLRCISLNSVYLRQFLLDSRNRGYLVFSVKDRNLFHRVDSIGNIFTSGAATSENITDGLHEMK